MKKIHYPQCAAMDTHQKAAMQQKLQREIHSLDRQLQALQASDNAADHQLVNSYKSMKLERENILTAIQNISPTRI